FRVRRPDVDIIWSRRPLHAFEFAPVHQLAEQYDLIVLDHPFVGDIAATRCLKPLDALLDKKTANAFSALSVETIRYDGKTWALPIDAACQVAVARPDLLATLSHEVPRTWDEM